MKTFWKAHGWFRLLTWAAGYACLEVAYHLAFGIPFSWGGAGVMLAAPTVISDVLTTGNIEPTQRVVNMDDIIHDLDPQATALTALLMKLRKEQTINPQFQFLEDEYAPKDSTANGAFTNVAGNFTVAAGQGTYFRPYDIIYHPYP